MEQLAVSDTNLPMPAGAWGHQDTSSKDMLLPSLLLMHDISDLVKKEQAKAGSIINSVTGETLAARRENLDIIPIFTFREWEIYELEEVKGKVKENYVGRVRMDAANEDAPYQYDEDGKSFKRYRTINLFVLVANQISELPYLVRFKKSNLYAGKKFSTHFQTCQMKNMSPAKQVFGLYSEEQTSNDNSYHVLNVRPTRLTTPEEEQVAFKWWKPLSSKDVKVADSEVPF